MRLRVFLLAALSTAVIGCRPKPTPSPTTPEATPISAAEFESLLTRCVIPPESGIDWVAWKLTEDDQRMLVLACTSPAHFDSLIDGIAAIPEPSFPGPFLGGGTYHSIKDCPLGDSYVQLLADRLLQEKRPKHRAATREAIQWHAFHAHARKGSLAPFVDSVPGKIIRYNRQDWRDDRWYGVVMAVYAPRYPEAEIEMWRAIRAGAEVTEGHLAMGAFETAFNRLRESPWVYRERFLKKCLELIDEARLQANPWAAGWMLKRQFVNYARGTNLRPGETFEWERELLKAASSARSQTFRGESIVALLALQSPRVVPVLDEWLGQNLPDSLVDEFLSELRLPVTPDRDPLAGVTHPRLRAHVKVMREFYSISSGVAAEVSYLRTVLKGDGDPEMRRAALVRLAYWLREDDRDDHNELPQGMSNLVDLLEPVLSDPSPQVRAVLAEALKRHSAWFSQLPDEQQKRIQRLFASLQ